MGDNTDSVKISKLQDVKDWSRWKFQITILLNDLDIYGIVTGNILKPVVKRQQGETEKQAHSRNAEELKEWSKKDIKVQKYLSTTIGDQAIVHIMNYRTAKEMWDKLHAVYEQKSETSIHLLQQKFFAYEFEEKLGVASHISKLEDLAKQLGDLEAPVHPSMLITRILTTLPPSYNHFHAAWKSTASKDRTITNLTSRLLVEETRIGAAEEQFNSTAFAARVSGQRRDYRSGQQIIRKPNQYATKPGKRFKCEKVGHWRRDYPMLKSNESQKGPGELQKGNDAKDVTPAGYQREEVGDALLCEAFIGEVEFCAARNESDKWFMDSGASDHMSNKRQ